MANHIKLGLIVVGVRYYFKRSRPYLIAQYGESAVVDRVQEVFTGSHPGRVFKSLIDLTTSNGTKVQWDVATMKSNFKEE